jgi:hypothetical protein
MKRRPLIALLSADLLQNSLFKRRELHAASILIGGCI